MRSHTGNLVTVTLFACGVLLGGHNAQADHSERLNELLSQGKLAEAETEFAKAASDDPDDQQAKLAVGLVQFVRAIEGLAQDQYRYGLFHQYASNIPVARIPVPLNPKPQQISYKDSRQIVSRFGDQIGKAEQSLAAVDTQDVKLSLLLDHIRIDIDANGEATPTENLWAIFSEINRGIEAQQGEEFSLSVDGADVHWLRGYCHVLMAFCDFGLAYDGREWFERCGHLLYPDVESPYGFLKYEFVDDKLDARHFADIFAAIHLLNFPLKDADKMRSAHQHLLTMVEQSRRSWERALAETDDDREWIPNPKQQGVIGLRVSREQIDGWHEVLDEFEALLKGKKLIPFWRGGGRNVFDTPDIPEQGTGINLKRFFTEPRDFDVVLFLTGTDAAPYLEEGPLSTPAAWQRMTRVFQGEFFGFAIWFN